MEIPWELKRYIDSQRQNSVNFSAVSSRSESISDGTTSIKIDSITKKLYLKVLVTEVNIQFV
jgi:hypothetical protein